MILLCMGWVVTTKKVKRAPDIVLSNTEYVTVAGHSGKEILVDHQGEKFTVVIYNCAGAKAFLNVTVRKV